MKKTKMITGLRTDEYSGSPLLSRGGDVPIKLNEVQEGKCLEADGPDPYR